MVLNLMLFDFIFTFILLLKFCSCVDQFPSFDIEWSSKSLKNKRLIIQGRTDLQSSNIVQEEIVQVDDMPWIRLHFDSESTVLQADDKLVIRSLFDKDFYQILDGQSLAEWQYSSAYFNGGLVKVSLINEKSSYASNSQFNITRVTVGKFESSQSGTQSLCTSDDRRAPIADQRVGRIVPPKCTGWIIDDKNHCFLSAGHCEAPGLKPVVQFNVPNSMTDGTIVHPHPNDQYAIDTSSIQVSQDIVIGQDFMYFGSFKNPNTGKYPHEVSGKWFNTTLVNDYNLEGKNLTINGYGSDYKQRHKSHTLQTHSGPFIRYAVGNTGNIETRQLRYDVDTTGGNSGSAVEVDIDGYNVAIAIHTNAGCSSYDNQHNAGTALNHPQLQNVLKNPKGVCKH